jgi:hypothetical protein
MREQHLADTNGMIDGTHKHAKSNLIALCKTCHTETHRDNIRYEHTTVGRKLQFR